MSDKPSSTKPSSKAPRISSSKPSSKMPKTEDEDTVLASVMFRDESKMPKQDKISSRISSKMSSLNPSSKMPNIEDDDTVLASAMFRDESKAPKQDKISSKISSSSHTPAKDQDKKAKSKFSAIPEDEELDEEYDDFEELSTPQSNYPELDSPSKKQQSRVQSSSTYYNAKSSISEKAKSVLQSAMFKDESKAPKAKSVLQSAMFKDESKAPKAKSVLQSAMFKDESKAPKFSSKMQSSLFKDENFVPKSFLVTKEDKIMSARQFEYTSLTDKEKEKQDVWAHKQIDAMDPCPEKYDWDRIDQAGLGGYVCQEGRHGKTDQMIAEGHGAIIMLEKKGDFARKLFGPWYPHPTIKNCYIWRERAKGEDFKGTIEKKQPAFLGTNHQRERAKWEFYSENFDESVRMGYKWPETEPPKEWENENNIPKTKEEIAAKRAAKAKTAKEKK